MPEIVIGLGKTNRMLSLPIRSSLPMRPLKGLRQFGVNVIILDSDIYTATSEYRRFSRFFSYPALAEWRQTFTRRRSVFAQPYKTSWVDRGKNIVLNTKSSDVAAYTNSKHIENTSIVGLGKIQNVTLNDAYPSNLPTQAEVFIMRLSDKKIIARLLSNSTTGQYVVRNLNMSDRYASIAFDLSGVYAPDIDTNIAPTLDNG